MIHRMPKKGHPVRVMRQGKGKIFDMAKSQVSGVMCFVEIKLKKGGFKRFRLTEEQFNNMEWHDGRPHGYWRVEA